MAFSAHESRSLVAAQLPEEEALIMPSPVARRGSSFCKTSAGRLLGGALALTALVSVCRFIDPGAALRGRDVNSMRGVQSLASEGEDEGATSKAAPLPLLFQTKDATPEVQELCDDVKEKVPELLAISGWSSVHLRDYEALSYCTDGMDYIVRVMVGVPYEEAKAHEKGVFLQLLLRKPSELEESRATQIFGALMVTPVDPKICGSLPVLPKIELPSPARLADVELPKAELPEAAPLPEVELPKVEDLPKVELPKVELPKVELPKVELPKVEDLPKVEPPKVELPKVEEPSKDAPAEEEEEEEEEKKTDAPAEDAASPAPAPAQTEEKATGAEAAAAEKEEAAAAEPKDKGADDVDDVDDAPAREAQDVSVREVVDAPRRKSVGAPVVKAADKEAPLARKASEEKAPAAADK